jgi:hypothetical protein
LTTLTPFSPLPDAPFAFSATFDGASYTVTVTWNLFSQRWYVSVTDNGGNLVFMLALIGSQDVKPISSISWAAGLVTVATATPLMYPVGSLVPLTIYGMTPSAYNGPQTCAVLNRSAFTYSLASNPGVVTTLGGYAFDVSMTEGYFDSTLIYRPTTGNFEVSP